MTELHGYLSVYSDGSCFHSLFPDRQNRREATPPVEKIKLDGLTTDQLKEILKKGEKSE